MIIAEVKIGEFSRKEAVNKIFSFFQEATQHVLASVNPEGILLARQNGRYRQVLNNASLALADGAGVVMAGMAFPERFKVQSSRFKLGRIAGVDLMQALCAEAAKNNWRVFLMGGVGETARRAVEKLREKFPGLIVEGEEGIPVATQNSKLKTQNLGIPSGQFQKFGQDPEFRIQNSGLISRINQFKPQLLFVALGQPKQELWIAENLSKLPSVRVAMGVGGAFDFISGNVTRAPVVMRKIGLEWFWRLIIQPWRLPRILKATIEFTWLVVREQFKR